MRLAPWPRKNKILSDDQVRYIRTGWQRAKAEGWQLKEWAQDCGALFGVAQKTIEGICWANSRRKLEECDG